MEHEKIGKFIAELRKEQGMTQQQLADSIGVSNKTISKWECGKGMPEISILGPLCNVLNININELLSGERLSTENYSLKAEENMIHFIEQTENNNRKNNQISLIMISITIIFIAIFTLFSCSGTSMFIRLFDIPTILCMLLIVIQAVLATKCWKSLFNVFAILNEKKNFSTAELIKSKIAIKLVSNLWLTTGIFISSIRFVSIIYIDDNLALVLEALDASIPIALTGLLYGLTGYLLLLPIRAKLDLMDI